MTPRPWPPSNPAGRYHRPNLGIWHAWFWAHDARRTTEAIAWTAIAWGMTATHAGLKVWRELTKDPGR